MSRFSWAASSRPSPAGPSDEYQASAHSYLHDCEHPSLGRIFRDCGYQPMVELLRYLEANGFTNYIASGGDRDFMRPVTGPIYGIPPERVVGSSNGLRYVDDEQGGSIVYLAEPDVFDDGPVKPVRIWSRIGRRPIVAGGNSNGDIPMLRYAGGADRPALRLLVLHDDPEREFDYVTGAEGRARNAPATRAGLWSASRTTGAASSPMRDGRFPRLQSSETPTCRYRISSGLRQELGDEGVNEVWLLEIGEMPTAFKLDEP